MIEIPITKGFTTLVSDEDSDLAKIHWTLSVTRRNRYAVAGAPFGGNHTTMSLHSVVLYRILGRKTEIHEVCDHINTNGLDNRRENLRVTTRSQNGCNRGAQSNNTCGYKGVYWHKASSKWLASIAFGGARWYLGIFDNIHDAARAYNTKAIEVHGEYAYLNIITEEQ